MKTQSIVIQHLSRAAMAGFALVAGPLHADNVLFLDTFNRPNSTTTDGTGLNESTDGKSGSLGALTWTGVTSLLSTGNIVDINGNRLRMDAVNTDGSNGGFAYISDHNFTDASIKSGGTFTVSVDIVSTSSAGDGRVIGFGVGSSLAELAAVSSASPGANPSDVFFIYDNVGASKGLRVYHNGALETSGYLSFPSGTPSPPDTLSGTFTFADMDAGTTLDYELFVDGISVVTGSTVWSGTDENYLCLGSTYSNPSYLDNFRVSLPGPPVLLATNPASDAINIDPIQSLVATFDEEIQLNTTGTITIKNLTTSTDTVISLPGPDDDGTLLIEGNTLTIDPTDELGAPGDELAIEISADAIKDLDDDFYAGILSGDDPNWSFTIDDIPPVPDYFQPIPGSDQAPLDGLLFIAFDEFPYIGSGNLTIYQADGTLVDTIDVTSGDVFVSDSRVSITPTVPLNYGTSYYVLIDSTAFTDELGNGYGISDPATWTFTTIANEPAMLFGDSFNREDGNDLNASTNGKYGSLGDLAYNTVNVNGVANIELSSGQLLLESNENDGLSGAVVYPDHNFVDAAIASAGGFSLTVDLNANLSGGSGRYLSVAVGRTAQDIDEQTSATAGGSAATADLVVALRNNDTLWIYENGTNVTGTGLADAPATPTTMRIDYSLADFNAGSTVNYEVFFDDSASAFYSGSFTWSGTEENYISLSSNLILTFAVGERHALFDNLQIRTKAEGGSSAYDTWANGELFEDDKNSDGVSNGLAFLLGAANPDEDALGKLPTSSQNEGLALTFSSLAGVDRGDAVLSLEYSSDLGVSDPWTSVVVPGVVGSFDDGSVHFEVTANGELLSVVATISPTEAVNGKLFSRLTGTP